MYRLIVCWGFLLGGAANFTSANSESTSGRILRHEVTLRASLDQVWHAWTTSGGLSTFFSTHNNVELRVGGPYELFLNVPPDKNGKRGGQGCKVLSYLPKEMLSFEWGFRPDIPSLRYAGAKTHVVLRFDSAGDGTTRVRLAQLGWGTGDDWDKGYDYFDKEWAEALDALKNLFLKKGPS